MLDPAFSHTMAAIVVSHLDGGLGRCPRRAGVVRFVVQNNWLVIIRFATILEHHQQLR